jgi:hypothetical protein
MDWEQAFSIANLAAMIGWVGLILLPRWRWLMAALRFGIIALLSVAYAALIFSFAAGAEGAGFSSLAGVRALFAVPPLLLAGWIHYLAFDLFVGTVIAEKSDARGLSRFIQAPILIATFMLGPLGYLLHIASLALPAKRAPQAA